MTLGVKPVPVTLAVPVNICLCPSLFLSSSLLMYLGKKQRLFNELGPCLLYGGLEWSSGSWLQPHPALSVCLSNKINLKRIGIHSFIYLKGDVQSDRESLVLKWPERLGLGRAEAKRSWSIQVSHMGGRNSVIWLIFCCYFPETIAGSRIGSSNAGICPGTVVRDEWILGGGLTQCSNNACRCGSCLSRNQ